MAMNSHDCWLDVAVFECVAGSGIFLRVAIAPAPRAGCGSVTEGLSAVCAVVAVGDEGLAGEEAHACGVCADREC